MTISKAVQHGTLIYIYDAEGRQATSVSAPGRWPGDGLKHYTPHCVYIQKGTLLYTYDARGRQVGGPKRVNQADEALTA